MDPLRAGQVLVFEDGFRYLCNNECRRGYVDGERSFDVPRHYEESGRPAPRKDPTTGHIRTRHVDDLLPLVHHRRDAARRAAPIPWVGLASALVAVILGAAAASWPSLAVLSAALTCVAGAAALHASREARADVGLLAWVLGPTGAILAAIAALLSSLQTPGSWAGLVGAAVAGAAMVVRAFLDQRAGVPVWTEVSALCRDLPEVVRVPVQDQAHPMDVSFVEKDVARVRTGEEVLAVEGETVAVDGVVQAGQAVALLHPGAYAPERRVPGDPLLAGARVVEGAVRILATRVGEDRAVLRPGRFGDGSTANPARIASLGHRATAWGGALAIAAAVASLLLSDGAGIEGPLMAAAAVLLAAPLLSVRRSAELPLIAAAAAASRRGIVFQDGRALDAAGRASVAALCTRGTVTEGDLEVVEVHPIGEADLPTLLSLAAAAEAVVEDHPIARCVLRFAKERGVRTESVRRATYVPGRGVTALAPGGEPFVIGNRRLLLDEGVSVAVADVEAARAEARGHTALFLGLAGRVRAVISLQDTPRPGARAAVQRIFDLDMEVVLLSGDHRSTVEALASNLDVDNVRAELLPEERGLEVERLRETGGKVAAVGRIQMDVAALSAADVPIALGAAGDAAAERSIALATDDVRDASAALWIARAARTAAHRAVLLSAGAGGIMIAAAALGWVAPAVAALVSVAVDAYALPSAARLLRRIELRVPARE